MRVSVDAERCQGHARCAAAAPNVFDLDDDAHAIVITPHASADDEENVRMAALACPEQAVRVDE